MNEDERHNQENAQRKLTMPVLAFGGERAIGEMVLKIARAVATNVRGGVIERCGHWIPEECPEYLTEQILTFFGEEKWCSTFFVSSFSEVYNSSMTPSYEQILSQAMALPVEDRQRLIEALSESAPAKPEYKADPKDAQAMKWINEHAKEYPGEWLALDGYRLLAHGKDLKEVSAAAKAQGVDLPLLHLVEPPREHPYIRS